MTRSITLAVESGNVLDFRADVLVLKYAQQLYGADSAVFHKLDLGHEPTWPKIGGYIILPSNGRLSAKSALFVGVERLHEFGYPEIRSFARIALASLATAAPDTRHIAITIHGQGYGLDEQEAFASEVAGLVDGVTSNDFPAALDRISFVERNPRLAARMKTMLSRLIPGGQVTLEMPRFLAQLPATARTALTSAGNASTTKPHVFIAMPFAEELEDVFHYGIQRAVNDVGLLCERADSAVFTGDVVDWVKKRISTATLMVADLSTANPNVYLEVGFAWGCNVPTVLLVRDPSDLKFDVRGNRCITYRTIKHLEETLSAELKGLLAQR